jgi:hypothetical protein
VNTIFTSSIAKFFHDNLSVTRILSAGECFSNSLYHFSFPVYIPVCSCPGFFKAKFKPPEFPSSINAQYYIGGMIAGYKINKKDTVSPSSSTGIAGCTLEKATAV